MENNYTVYYGIEHLNHVYTSTSIAFDTETLQLQPEQGKLRLLQLGCYASKAIVVIDCFDLDEEGWRKLNLFFINGDRFWLAHNAVFDLAWLQEHGMYPRGRVRCSMIASRLLTNGIPNIKHGLDAVAKRHLGVEVSKEQQRSNWGAETLSEEQLKYAAKDVEVLLEIDQTLDKKMRAGHLHDAFALECRALPAMAQMWRVGLPWNKEALEKARTDLEHDAEELGKEFIRELDAALPEGEKLPRDGTKEIQDKISRVQSNIVQMGHDPEDYIRWGRQVKNLKEDLENAPFNLRAKDEGAIRLGTKKYAGFNLNSPKQLVGKFAAVLGFEPLNDEGKPSASRQSLRKYAADHKIIQTYLEWKRKEKRRQMITSIQEKMGEDGFVRASYMQLGADTGRMSSIKPNNQQIPRDVEFRKCVEAADGWKIVDADFSQMELRLAAALANDINMISAFQAGEDLHDYTAKQMGCERQIAKSANFGLLYGAGAEGLRNYAGASGVLMTKGEAEKVRADWLSTYSGIQLWQKRNQIESRESEHDEWPETRIPVSGMRRYLKGDLNRVTVRCNTPIQGAGAAILKCALGSLWPLVKEAGEDTVKIAAAVHDELILLAKEDVADQWAATLKEVMEKAESKWLGKIPALAEVSIGKTWWEVH
tara:strand:- start:157 stop:2106 length:1950 start_codon:yes stop_codon:yes gene_type:complete